MSDTPGQAVELVEPTPDAAQVSEATAVAETAPASPPTSPAPESVSLESEAPPAESPAQPPALDLSTYAPPEGGRPWTPRVDGTTLALTGAMEYPTGYWIPRETFSRELKYHMGNRDVWQRERETLVQENQRLQTVQNEGTAKAQALLGKLDQLFGDENAALAALENWRTEGPRLMAEAERELLKTQVTRYERLEQQRQEQARFTELIPQLRDQVGLEVEEILSSRGVPWNGDATSKEQWARWFEETWQDYGLQALYPNGRLDVDRIERLVERELLRQRSQSQQGKQVQKAVEQNKAALAAPAAGRPTPAKPPKPPPKPEGDYQSNREEFDRWFATLKVE